MVTIFLLGGVSIGALVHYAQLEKRWYHRAFQEPYDGNRQQLRFVPHCIHKVACNVLHDGHPVLRIGQNVLHSFRRSKQPSQWWLDTFGLLQFCWMHLNAHATACTQGTYVICCSKGFQLCSAKYLRRAEIKRLVVEWTCTVVEFRHSYNDVDQFNSYGSRLNLQISHYLAVQTRHIL